MTLKARAILAYEAKRDDERLEAEDSARRVKDCREMRLQELCNRVLGVDPPPVQWLMVYDGSPGYMWHQIPVCDIDGLLFTRSDKDEYPCLVVFNKHGYAELNIFSLDSLGEQLSHNPNTGEIREGSIYPAIYKN